MKNITCLKSIVLASSVYVASDTRGAVAKGFYSLTSPNSKLKRKSWPTENN